MIYCPLFVASFFYDVTAKAHWNYLNKCVLIIVLYFSCLWRQIKKDNQKVALPFYFVYICNLSIKPYIY